MTEIEADGVRYRLLTPFTVPGSSTRRAGFAVAAPVGGDGVPVLVKDYLMSTLPGSRGARLAAAAARRAAAIGRALSHPSIMRVYGLGQDRYLVMERVEGENLLLLRQQGRLPRAAIPGLLLHLARALIILGEQLTRAFPHAPGMGHADLKLANVMLRLESGSGLLKLIDLDDVGLQLSAEEPIGPARRFWVQQAGMRAHRAPELLLGRLRYADLACDVFSFGVVAFWLLHGRPPFLAEDEYLVKLDRMAAGDGGPALLPDGVAALPDGPMRRLLVELTAFDRAYRCPSLAAAFPRLKALLRPASSTSDDPDMPRHRGT